MPIIKIIRHSERLDFTYPLYWIFCIGQYWSDSPLTRNGHLIAAKKGKKLIDDNFKPKKIYTSPYKRTLATATEIKTSFPSIEIIIEPLLAEHQPNYKHNIDLYPNGIPTDYNGETTIFKYPESYSSFSKRIKFIIDNLMKANTEDFIIVTHGEVLKTFINYLNTLYPNIVLDPGNTPYLTILSFEYNENIIESSIKIE